MKKGTWKTVLYVTAAILAIGLLAGCGNSQDNAQAGTENGTGQAAVGDTQTAENTGNAEGKTLVAYYSASGTTRGVAEKIADAAGADLFEITPAESYTDADLDWTDDNSRVTREHEDESLRDVELETITPDNWDSYDVVFIGYPIWWGIAAWPVDNFVSGNDFSGKTVIPFCTSASSGIGSSGELLAALADTGDWQEGHRFSGSASDADIMDWTASLGL